jgi:predicted permease
MLARGFARRKEMAVRLAIGAGRSRVVRHLLAESLTLFAVGGLLGTALAWVGTSWLTRVDLPPQVPTLLLHLTPDGRVLAFAIVLTGLTGVGVGLIPAVQSSRPELVPALRTGFDDSPASGGRMRHMFVGTQVALTVTLLLVGTLFARSLRMGLETELGFEPEGAVAATIDLGPPLDYDEERGRAFHRALLERVRALPGVESAGLSRLVLATGSSSSDDVGRPDAPQIAQVNASYTVVDPGYFATMRITLEAGRGFTPSDDAGTAPVVVINHTLAERLFAGENPLGQRIEGFGLPPAEVVGVTGDGRYAAITEQPRPFAYFPWTQSYRPSMALHVRAPGYEATTLQAIALEVRALEPNAALRQAGLIEEAISFSLFPQRFAAQLVGTFGVVGLVLAALGIYGVLAFQVARRTREIGVRRALGATSARVVRGVVGRASLVAAIGCAAGMLGGGALAVAARSFLYGIRPLDPITFIVVPAVLFGVALVASWLPAARAARVEATVALRSE